MKKTLKVISALLTYPTEELKAAVPDLRAALDDDDVLSPKTRERLDVLLEELETLDVFDLQERYVLLFDRTRSLSLHLFEHVHGESRDRGQAMVDLQQLYQDNGMNLATSELPDFIPLFLEFLSTLPNTEAIPLLNEPVHIFEAIRQRLKKRKSSYTSVFSSLQIIATAKPKAGVVEAMLEEPDHDPNDMAALDAAWEEEEVTFGPTADQCGKDDLMAKLRSGTRLAPGVPRPEPKRTVFTHKTSNPASGG